MSKFDDIKIPDNIDEVTKNAIRRGKTKKHRHRRMNKVASIVAIGGVGILVGFPVIAKALPNIESLITSFIESALPQSHVNKLKDKSNANNIVVKDENAIITLEKSVLDSQIFVASMTIESDFLKQYDENDLRYNLYANTHISIGDKDNLVGGGPDIIKKIDENKATLVVSAYVGDTETDNNIDVYINLENLEIKSNEWKNEDRKELKGDWKFYINVEKENTIEKIDVKDSVNIEDNVMTFEILEKTPLATYIKLTYDETLDNKWHFGRYKIVDNNGKEYRYSQIDGHTYEGKWNIKLAIYDDLSNIESLSITPYTEDTFI